MSELHIYHVATEFLMAHSQKEAEQYYVETVGQDDASTEEMDTEEVPEEKWDSLKIVDIDEVGHPEETFREAFNKCLAMENQEYPKILASTEY